MCHDCIINKKINRLRERRSRIIYGDKQSSFEELLEKDNSVSINERNIQILATKMSIKLAKVCHLLRLPNCSNEEIIILII